MKLDRSKVFSWGGGKIIEAEVLGWKDWVPELLDQFHGNQQHLKKSHKIRGRWENLYLDIEKASVARIPVRFARDLAKEVLDLSSVVVFDSLPNFASPYPPFWFNLAFPGESTGLHDHAQSSILSGVVYLDCEPHSGNLYFQKEGEMDLEIIPRVGKLVLFEPWMRHGVMENRSSRPRISLAFNLFAFPLPTLIF